MSLTRLADAVLTTGKEIISALKRIEKLLKDIEYNTRKR